jgi:hypothetical protein
VRHLTVLPSAASAMIGTGTFADANQKLGKKATIRQAFIDIQRVLYRQ